MTETEAEWAAARRCTALHCIALLLTAAPQRTGRTHPCIEPRPSHPPHAPSEHTDTDASHHREARRLQRSAVPAPLRCALDPHTRHQHAHASVMHMAGRIPVGVRRNGHAHTGSIADARSVHTAHRGQRRGPPGASTLASALHLHSLSITCPCASGPLSALWWSSWSGLPVPIGSVQTAPAREMTLLPRGHYVVTVGLDMYVYDPIMQETTRIDDLLHFFAQPNAAGISRGGTAQCPAANQPPVVVGGFNITAADAATWWREKLCGRHAHRQVAGEQWQSTATG